MEQKAAKPRLGYLDKSHAPKKLGTMAHSKEADVVIIGGGPAGSTAGALLAEKGWHVVILEKERFPRYHIGESLMPYCYFTFERLECWIKSAN